MKAEGRASCIYCSSSEGLPEEYHRLAADVVTRLVERGDRIVFGGIHRGLMATVAETALRLGADVTGVIPESKRALGDAHNAAANTRNIYTDGIALRKATMVELASEFIVLPGGYGTLDELFFTITEICFGGLRDKHITLYNPDGLYDPLLEQLATLRSHGLLTAPVEQTITVVRNLEAQD